MAVAGVAVALGIAERGGGEAVEIEGRAGGEFGGLEIERFAARQIGPERPLVAERQVGQAGGVERVEENDRPERQESRRAAAEPGRRGYAAQHAGLKRLLDGFFRNPREEGGLADGQVGG